MKCAVFLDYFVLSCLMYKRPVLLDLCVEFGVQQEGLVMAESVRIAALKCYLCLWAKFRVGVSELHTTHERSL